MTSEALMIRNYFESGILTFQKQYLRRKSDKLTAKDLLKFIYQHLHECQVFTCNLAVVLYNNPVSIIFNSLL